MTGKNERFQTPCRSAWAVRAFTLIELLVVIAIIGIIASLALVGLPGVASKRDKAKVNAAKINLVTAINAYKEKYGAYPPDTLMESTNTLFYELAGVELFAPGPVYPVYTYKSKVNDSQITAAAFTNIFNVDGLMNVSYGNITPGKVVAKSFMEVKSADYATLTSANGIVFNILTVPGKPALGSITNAITNSGRVFNPWHYKSANPIHNPGEFDLWAVFTDGKNVITNGNWGKN